MTTLIARPDLTPRNTLRPPRSGSHFFAWVARHVALVTIAVLAIAPVLFVLLTSLMSDREALTSKLIPTTWEWGNYLNVFTTVPLAQWFANSATYAGLATGFMLISSVPAAYVLARVKFRGSGVLFFIIIIAMLLPPEVKSVPLYVMWSQLGLTGTLWPLILPNLLGDAFSIFLLRQFFLTIPNEYADAARIDGCGEWGVLLRVVVPMARPGIAAAAIFSFFYAWNDYFGPLLYTSQNKDAWPVSYGLATFHGTHSVNWPTTMAVTMLVTVPVVIIFFFAQKSFVEGIALSGVKG